jgi:hypothetical protein
MKKIILLALLLLCGTISAFSLQENWTGTGFSFGNTIEFTHPDITTYLGSAGFYISGYSFQDKKPIGAFVQGSFIFPVITQGNEQNYDMQIELLLGISSRLSITNVLKLYGGLGVDFHLIRGIYYKQGSITESEFLKFIHNFGLGGDIGLKYDLTDFLYINLGCTLTYTFFNHTSIRSYTKMENIDIEYLRREGSVKGYNTMTVKPYIGIGFNYYADGKAAFGKPQ